MRGGHKQHRQIPKSLCGLELHAKGYLLHLMVLGNLLREPEPPHPARSVCRAGVRSKHKDRHLVSIALQGEVRDEPKPLQNRQVEVQSENKTEFVSGTGPTVLQIKVFP